MLFTVNSLYAFVTLIANYIYDYVYNTLFISSANPMIAITKLLSSTESCLRPRMYSSFQRRLTLTGGQAV